MFAIVKLFKFWFYNQKGVSASSMTKQNPQLPVRKDKENTAYSEDDLYSGKEYPDQIKSLEFKQSADYADTPSVIKETHTTDTRDVRKHHEMPDNRFYQSPLILTALSHVA